MQEKEIQDLLDRRNMNVEFLGEGHFPSWKTFTEVMSTNHKYDFTSLINIYTQNRNARGLATEKFWNKYNINVKDAQKPVIIFDENEKIIAKLYDITQIDKEKPNLQPFYFDKKNQIYFENVLKKSVVNRGKNESIELQIERIIENSITPYEDKELNELAVELIKYSVAKRFKQNNIELEFSNDFSLLKNKNLNDFGEYLVTENKKIMNYFIEEYKKEIKIEKQKIVNEKDSKIITKELNFTVKNQEKELPEEKFETELIKKDKTKELLEELLNNGVYTKLAVANQYELEEDNLTPGEKLKANILALETLLKIESEERNATIEEQKILSKYSGWGGLSEVFDNTLEKYIEERNFLKENFSKEDIEKMKESTLTAFYTENTLIDGIYSVLNTLEVENPKILEPSCGTGNFIARNTIKNAKFYGVELDTTTSKIAKYLYPEAIINNIGFEKAIYPDNYFDVAIGNIPFGNFQIYDEKYRDKKLLIHDYFFIKSLDKVKEDGIVAFITSAGTLDKENSEVREYISEKAAFLGAIRLPETAFKNAGTSVVTDIIFLQKTNDENKKGLNSEFKNTIVINDMLVNEYFFNHKEMVLGQMTSRTGRFGKELTVINNEKIDDLLKISLENIKKNIEKNKKKIKKKEEKEIEVVDIGEIDTVNLNIKNRYFEDKQNIYLNNGSTIEKITDFKDVQKYTLYKNYIELSKDFEQFVKAKTENYTDEYIKKAQDNLEETYKKFNENAGTLKENRTYLVKDSNYTVLASFEIFDEKGNFKNFRSFTNKETKIEVVKANNVKEALLTTLGVKGKVDFEYMKTLIDKSENDLRNELIQKKEIYLDVKKIINAEKEIDVSKETGIYITKDAYLSGNIYEKLEDIEKIKKQLSHPILKNISKFKYLSKNEYVLSLLNEQEKDLESIKPQKLKAEEIEVDLGATWIPLETYNEFLSEVFSTRVIKIEEDKSEIDGATNRYQIPDKASYNHLISKSIKNLYGTASVTPLKVLEDTLNSKSISVYKKIGNDRILDKEETLFARKRQEELNLKFKEWILETSSRKDLVEKIYNRKFNSIVLREYSGEELIFPEMEKGITLKEHQKAAVARCLYSGNTLLAHTVGAGKTFVMISSIMESKRLGLSKKAMMVVPNHLTEQIGADFKKLYPTADILVATKKDFTKENRVAFTTKIATGNYDAIIIGHSQFERLPISEKRQELLIRNEIEKLERLKEKSQNRITTKNMEAAKKSLTIKLEKILNAKKDNSIPFDALGIDKLVVDEAHYFKNIAVKTNLSGLAGINSSQSNKALDMKMKVSYLNEITDEKGVIFATGTPLSNSITELYIMQSYLQEKRMRELDIQDFDSWAKWCTVVSNNLELAPEGTGYRNITRVEKFKNLPELKTVFKEIADIKTADDLDLDTPKANFIMEKISPNEYQKDYILELAERAEKVRGGIVDSTEDNMLKITGDGKKVALDPRLVNPNSEDFENSKVNHCVKNVVEIYKETEDKKSTQLIFCDMSTPKKDEFNIYDDIKQKLIEKGVEANEIEFIHNADTEEKKDKLFEKVRAGEIRVLLGSTAKMGAGTNVQTKLIALHDLDVPWRPADLEQRAGRIVRQGNENKEVKIFRYVTEGTFDAYLWQTLENKQKFISQVMTNKVTDRTVDGIAEAVLKYSEVKALATGNPLIKEKMELEIELQKLEFSEAKQIQTLSRKERSLEELPKEKAENLKLKLKLEKDLDKLKTFSNSNKESYYTDKNLQNFKKQEIDAVISKKFEELKSGDGFVDIGKYNDFDISIKENSLSKYIKISGESEYLIIMDNSTLFKNYSPYKEIEKVFNTKKIEKNIQNCYEKDIKLESEIQAFNNTEIKIVDYSKDILDIKNRLEKINIELGVVDKEKNEKIELEVVDKEKNKEEKVIEVIENEVFKYSEDRLKNELSKIEKTEEINNFWSDVELWIPEVKNNKEFKDKYLEEVKRISKIENIPEEKLNTYFLGVLREDEGRKMSVMNSVFTGSILGKMAKYREFEKKNYLKEFKPKTNEISKGIER